MKIIIPSAKIVNEDLQKIGKLPPVIYPLNNGIVFDLLFEQYRSICDSIEIICYEKSEKVHRRIASYKNKKIHIVDLPKLGDLGETIYYAIKEGIGEIIVNFGDTIVMEELTNLPPDSYYYSEDYFSERWTYFRNENGMILDIQDKAVNNSSDEKKHSLFVGVFRFSDMRLFSECLKDAIQNRSSIVNSFYIAVQKYSSIKPLIGIYTNNWFDIGHADRYYSSTLEVRAREFNHIRIDKDRGILTKTSENVDKFIGEIKWYLKLPADIEYVRPRIFDYSTSYTDPYISMEYYAYHTVHELFLYGDLTKKQWSDLFSRIAFVLKDFRRYSVRDSNMKESIEDMYLKKTLQRFDEMRGTLFDSFFENEINVNGIKYISLDNLAKLLKKTIPAYLYDVTEFNIIHGDMCFSNIMVDSNYSFIKLIDPRGKFGKYDIYGDSRYELAKLFHSVDGKYDYIIKDLFNISYDLEKREIKYSILDRSREYDLYQIFIDSFREEIGDNLQKIEIIEALLFLSMIPLHRESIEHQMAMLGIGLDILNRVIDITA